MDALQPLPGLLAAPLLRAPAFNAMVVLLRVIEVSVWLLGGAWILFWFVMIGAFFAGRRAVRATQGKIPDEAERSRRTNWTARLTLALPAVFFLMLAFAAWAGILNLALPLLPHDTAALPPLPNSYADKGYKGAICLNGSLRSANASASGNVLCYAPLLPRGVPARTAAAWAHDALPMRAAYISRCC
jgi:hypothetical protein